MSNEKFIEFDWKDDLNNNGHIKGSLVEITGMGYMNDIIKIRSTNGDIITLRPIPKLYKHTKVIIPDSINFPLQNVYQWSK